MNNKRVRFGPYAITTSATCLCSPGSVSAAAIGTAGGTSIANLFYDIRHVRVLNTTSSPISVSGFIGSSSTAHAAGTEFFGSGLSIAANDSADYYGYTRIDNGEFLNWLAGGLGLTVIAEGEVGIA